MENPFLGPFEVKRLAASVAGDFGLPLEHVIGPKCNGPSARARAVVVKFCLDRGMSLGQVAKHLGGRHHTTILNSRRQFPTYVKYWRVCRESYERHERLEAENIALRCQLGGGCDANMDGLHSVISDGRKGKFCRDCGETLNVKGQSKPWLDEERLERKIQALRAKNDAG